MLRSRSWPPRKYEQRLRAEASDATRRRILDALEQRLREAPDRTGQPRRDRAAGRAWRAPPSTSCSAPGRGCSTRWRPSCGTAPAWPTSPKRSPIPTRGSTCAAACAPAWRSTPRCATSPSPLFSMSALDPESVGGAIARLEERRWGGMQYLAGRLDEQDLLRPDVTVEEAADVLWMLTSFASFDALYTGRGLPADEVAARPRRDRRAHALPLSQRTLCRWAGAGRPRRRTRWGPRDHRPWQLRPNRPSWRCPCVLDCRRCGRRGPCTTCRRGGAPCFPSRAFPRSRR